MSVTQKSTHSFFPHEHQEQRVRVILLPKDVIQLVYIDTMCQGPWCVGPWCVGALVPGTPVINYAVDHSLLWIFLNIVSTYRTVLQDCRVQPYLQGDGGLAARLQVT